MSEPPASAMPAPPPEPPATDSGKPARDRFRAIGLMLLALVFFTLLDTVGKLLAGGGAMPITQLSWMRFVVQFTLLLVLVPAFGLLSVEKLFTTRRLGQQLVRSTLMAATTVFNFLALKYLRLDQTITVVFLAPLVVALLAGPLLGEWVGWRRFVAILVGFVGILVAVRPGVGGIPPGIAYSFAGMLAYALFMLLTRHLSAYDPPLVTLFYSMFVGTVLGAPLAIGDWVWPADATTWVLLLSLGILGGIGHYLFILAYGLAPASAVAPFLYAQFLTMAGLGYVVFGDVPDVWTLAGAAIITASGIYLVHRERVTKGLG